MKKCNNDCTPICDFCTTNFQGIDEQCPLGDINL